MTICCTPLASVTGVAMPKNSRKPGICLALVMTSSTPPALMQPTVTTTISATIMTTACMKSEALSARKPPMIVYSRTNTAPTIIMGM